MSDIRGAPPGVDATVLDAEIDRRLATRSDTAPPPDLPPPFIGAAADPIERARTLVGRAGVEYEIGWRTPLLGQAWAAVRETIHGEARLYVDALMARQAELDAALLEAIESLAARVAQLESSLHTSSDET